MDKALITDVFGLPAEDVWKTIFSHLWQYFSQPIRMDIADAVTTERDRHIASLDNILSGSAWELWQQFKTTAPRTSQALKQFWSNQSGRQSHFNP